MSQLDRTSMKRRLGRLARDYGMLGVLILLCILFSVLTIDEQHPMGEAAAKLVAERLPTSGTITIVAAASSEDSAFAQKLSELVGLSSRVRTIQGDPSTVRAALTAGSDTSGIIVSTEGYAPVVRAILAQLPSLRTTEIIVPPSYRWPTFLLANNIRNVANQIAVIALVAIGMTMVIITAGIDLSVGSLIALSAVFAGWVIAQFGGEGASGTTMLLASIAAIALCGATGAFSGLMITRFGIPPFIATLAMMQVAAGVAYIISEGKPIYQIPQNFTTLGRGVDPLLHIPYAVILMAVLYIAAHVIMSRTVLGRYIYAVGGNAEAARLAGIRVKAVLFSVYAICGLLAGLGGVVLASQLKSGAPTYGLTYELYVIAAVVVGGTSLSGGEGKVFGTLIGAFVIAVIQNGMNLTNVETYTQKVVLGLVILGAVLLDRIKQQGMAWKRKRV
jgi:ribose transport system permease protein